MNTTVVLFASLAITISKSGLAFPSFLAEGDLTDPASCPRSGASDPQTFIGTPLRTGTGPGEVIPHSPTFRYNPFNQEPSTSPSVTAIPVHVSCPEGTTTKGEMESVGTDLEVIRSVESSWLFICMLLLLHTGAWEGSH